MPTRLARNSRNLMDHIINDGPSIPIGEGIEQSIQNAPFDLLEVRNIESEDLESNIHEPSLELNREFERLFDNARNQSFSTYSIGNILDSHKIKLDKIIFNETKYKDDDFIKLQNGKKELFKNSVAINGSWYSKTDNDICLDYFSPMNYILKNNSNVIYTKFDIDGNVDKKIINYYANRYDKIINLIVRLYDQNTMSMVDYNQIPKEFYNECFKDLSFHHNKSKHKIISKKELKIKARKSFNIYKPSLNKSNLTKDYLMGVISPSFIKTEGKRYTFGIELETISGALPNYIEDTLNYQSIRDGSLKNEDGEEYGYEYVTGVLIGDTGLLQTKKLCNALTERCIVDIKCGMHIHLGGVKFTSELIVYLYKLYLIVEKDIFNMVPLSRKNNEYCKKLKWFDFNFTEESFNNPNMYNGQIESYYNLIYKFVANRDAPSDQFNKKSQHPLGAKCGYNHNTARYCWVNFVPTLFDTRGNGHYTIENRIHQGTTNFKKVKNWTLINMGLLWFAENHKKDIALNYRISLCDIMQLAYPKSYLEINEYINEKTKKFNKQDDKENKQSELDDYIEIVDDQDLTIKKL